MRTLYLAFIILFLAAPVSAKEGFLFKWSYEGDKAFTSISAIDVNKSRYLDHIIAGSLDNRVYVFSKTGGILGSYEAGSSVTSVAAFVHDGDAKMNDGIAGSLDDYVYAFWRPYGTGYFKSSSHWWNYTTDDNVYSVGVFDYNQSGQLDGVVAGTGNYADREYGKILAFSRNGTKLWSYSTSSAVRVLTHADLGSDNIMGDVVAGAGKSVYILNSDGTLIWKYDAPSQVYAISHADFDLDGEKDDILIGAGNTTYAVDSHKKLLWKHDFNGKISSITAVDNDNDGVIDYYLVSSGSVLYALKNDPGKGLVLWQYDVKREIDAHVSLDFDNDGVLDDLGFISENRVYAYDFDYLYLPELHVSKIASAEELSVGDKVTIALKFENKGNGKAEGVSFRDSIPSGLKLAAGNISWADRRIPAWKEDTAYYTLEAVEKGKYELPATTVYYSDSYGNSYSATSNTLTIEVKEVSQEVTPQKTNLTTSIGSPEVMVYRTLSKQNITLGENVTVIISLDNLGEKPALTVNFEDEVPEGFALVQGETSWKGVLEPGESKKLSYTLEFKTLPEAAKEVTFKELVVYYRDESGKVYEAIDEEKILGIAGGKFDWKKLIYLMLFLAAGIAAIIYRKRFMKKKEIDPRLEEKFIRVYVSYQKRGERPTYEVMKKELDVEINELDNIAKNVKKKFGISSANAVFSKIKKLLR